jgi:hypothetical protein
MPCVTNQIIQSCNLQIYHKMPSVINHDYCFLLLSDLRITSSSTTCKHWIKRSNECPLPTCHDHNESKYPHGFILIICTSCYYEIASHTIGCKMMVHMDMDDSWNCKMYATTHAIRFLLLVQGDYIYF